VIDRVVRRGERRGVTPATYPLALPVATRRDRPLWPPCGALQLRPSIEAEALTSEWIVQSLPRSNGERGANQPLE